MADREPPALDANFTTAILTRVGVDRFARGRSALGDVFIAWTGYGVSAIRLAAEAQAEAAFADWYGERIGRRVVAAVETDAIVRSAQAKLLDPAAGDVPLDIRTATPFEREVFERVAQLRWGYARPFELLAREVGGENAPHDVADVLQRNAVPLLVPCHRVVGSDRCCRSAYVFGPDAQRRLLAAEGLSPSAVDRVIARGFAFIENDGWFCLPTCGDIAEKIDLPGYAGLRSLADVEARGLQACESCRPLAA